MEGRGTKEGPLTDVRVLDLANESGVYCTKLLADLGADVIRIEPLGGDPMRTKAPFVMDEPHPEKSLYFFHFNTSKRSITLNLDTVTGREIFKELVRCADIVVETFLPGYLDDVGLGYAMLSEINPRLILVSITGFGQNGPYRHFRASDVVGVATGGLMYLGGFPEEPPNYPGANQGYHLASVDGATGALVALCERDLTGIGQQVDVSMQAAVCQAIEHAMVYWDVRRGIRKRTGRQVYRGWNEVFPCKDGHIFCSPFGGAGWKKMLELMDSEGMAADLDQEKYHTVLAVMADRQMDRGLSSKPLDPRLLKDYTQEIAHIEEVWEHFTMAYTANELLNMCQTVGVRLLPAYNAQHLVEDPHLNDREFFVSVHHPELGISLKYPGGPYRLSETPWAISRRAPLAGEHNLDIYRDELGFSLERIAMLREGGII